MKFIKKNWLKVSVVCLILIALIKLTDPGGTGFEKKLDSILPSDRNKFDFTHTVVSLSSLIDPGTDIAWTESELDNMSKILRARIGENSSPDDIIKAFNGYFFEEQGFIFDNKFTEASQTGGEITVEELRNFHSIEKALKRKQGICLSISLIYLILGDKLRLPLYGVLLPGHIYVRYKEPGRAGVNIETTGSGFEYYGYKEEIARLDPEKTLYGRELDGYSVIGAYLMNIGNYFISTGQYKKAEITFRKSIEIIPGAAESYLNMGILSEMQKKRGNAVENYEKSLQFLPGNGYAHYRLGAIYLSEQRFTKAQDNLEDAVKAKIGGEDAVKLLEKAKNKDAN